MTEPFRSRQKSLLPPLKQAIVLATSKSIAVYHKWLEIPCLTGICPDGRDWIIDCDAQLAIYDLLTQAIDALDD